MSDIVMNQLSMMVLCCPLRSCNWTSEDVRGISLVDQEHVAGEHLRHHRSDIEVMWAAIQ